MNNRNKALIITGVILLVVATIIFIIAGWLAGWNIKEWVETPAFVWTCVILGLYTLSVIALLLYDKINRL